MKLPDQLPEDADRGQVREQVRLFWEYLKAREDVVTENSDKLFVDKYVDKPKPATWSNTETPDDVPFGTMKEIPGTSLVDVWDLHGWQRMSREYYEMRFGHLKAIEKMDEPLAVENDN